MDKVTRLRLVRLVTFGGLALLVAVAFFIRAQFIAIYGGQDYLSWAAAQYYGGITPAYLNAASSILAGRAYPYLSYPPGYPIFLAAAQWLGVSGLSNIRLLQAFIDSLTVLGIYLLLRRLASSRALA
ncbi:MAG: hypothetical protein ACREBW_04220, partial [Candidatus Micrarchaeaceae archaeon]